jgi:cellulose synthase/poly-beta-1,6-N-acetylglucosamine synthase-like glycosyltransferase
LFLHLQNQIRQKIPITASGELILIKRSVFERVLPLKPCKAEDCYILFKVLEHGYDAVFCDECYAETERTKTAEEEEAYKRRTVAGIYQALSYTRPSLSIRLFYIILPLLSPLLLVSGKNGYFWMKGILLGFMDYLHGDRSGVWQATYMR